MPKKLIYAGIGSRETPEHVLEQMTMIGQELANTWTLRSGHAFGADMAFENGCAAAKGDKEIYVPWYGFNNAPHNHPDYIRPKATQEVADLAASFHPAWNKCTDAAKLMHMRNTYQVLGCDTATPATMVVCWTKDGNRGGGTGQALRIASHYDVPIFDLAVENDTYKMCDFINSMSA